MSSVGVSVHPSHVSWNRVSDSGSCVPSDNKKEAQMKRVNHVKSLSSDTSSENTEDISLMDSNTNSNGASGTDNSSTMNSSSVADLSATTAKLGKNFSNEADVSSSIAKSASTNESSTMVEGGGNGNGCGYTGVVPTKVPSYEDSIEYFRWVDNVPRHPPSYKAVNPNRRITYPIYETVDNNVLPKYTPAVREITVVSMKNEWLNPYELSTSRAWKNFIMEINSTQLNFYYIHESLTSGIRNYYGGPSNFTNDFHAPKQSNRFLPSLHSKSTYQFNRADQEWITKMIKSNEEKYLSTDLLFRSFSLQYGKFGIPTDYTKKTFVLRLRCELQQFLINFAHVDDMIDWSVYLSIGIDVSLDLACREMPTYRTVPRRRRRGHRRRRRRRRRNIADHSNSLGLQRMLQVGTGQSPKPLNGKNERRASSASTGSCTDSNIRPVLASSRSTGFVLESLKSRSRSTQSLGVSTPQTGSPSSKTEIQRRSSDSSLKGIKSKLATMFHYDRKTPSRSKRKTSNASTLNCVIEDEDDEEQSSTTTPTAKSQEQTTETPISSPHKRTQSVPSVSSSSSSPLPKANDATPNSIYKTLGLRHAEDVKPINLPSETMSELNEIELGSISVISHNAEDFSSENDLSAQTGYQNAISSRLELNELQTILNEHNEQSSEETEPDHEDLEDDEEEEDDDEDDDDGDEDDEDDEDELGTGTSGVTLNHPHSASSSIYHEEGIFHDSDDDYIYVPVVSSHRQRTSSVTSNLSHTPYGSSEYKWKPPRKEITRRRYIRDSLRCVRPLGFDESWVNKIALAPSMGPKYETNNPPISGFASSNDSPSKTKLLRKLYNTQPALLLSKCKNHYLTPYIITPSGLVRATPKE